jgi:CARDB
VTVQRTGGSLSAGSYVLVRVYLSTDPTITTSDYRCSFDDTSAQFSVSSLNASGSLRQDIGCSPGDVSVGPIAAGTYYWGAIVDPTSFHSESNESNNVIAGGTVSVR